MDAPGHVDLSTSLRLRCFWASSPALNAVNIQATPSRYSGHGQDIPSGNLSPDW